MAAELHSRALPRPALRRRCRRQQQPRCEQRGLPPSLAGSTPLSPPLLHPQADVSLAASGPTCRGCCSREARGPARPPARRAGVPEGAGPSRQHGAPLGGWSWGCLTAPCGPAAWAPALPRQPRRGALLPVERLRSSRPRREAGRPYRHQGKASMAAPQRKGREREGASEGTVKHFPSAVVARK